MSGRYRFLAATGDGSIAIEVAMAGPVGAKGAFLLERLAPPGDDVKAYNVFRAVFALAALPNSVLLHLAALTTNGTGSASLRVVQGGGVRDTPDGPTVVGGVALSAEVMDPVTHKFVPAKLGPGNVLTDDIGAGATEVLAITTIVGGG